MHGGQTNEYNYVKGNHVNNFVADFCDDKNNNDVTCTINKRNNATGQANCKNKRRPIRRGNRKSKQFTATSKVNIAFNNVNRVKYKLYDIRKLIRDQSIDIFGIAESFLQDEEQIEVKGYTWIGKNRSSRQGGGIGLLVSDQFSVVDDNVCNSKSDEYERLWIRVKICDIFVNLAVAYFPVEGANPDLTDDLYNQLLSEVIQLENECKDGDPHILIMGDFNGRIGSNIYGGDPILNSNGERLLNFRDDACLNIVNCSNKCHGKITWFRHPHSSCIDYFLSSNSIDKCIEKMIVDEDRNFHIGSDHNILMLYLKFKPSKHSYNKPKVMHKTWNISHDQDWSAF
jgi:exonuclease III